MAVSPSCFVVAGAGISGLCAAYRLRKAVGPAARILVVEPGAEIGGKLKTISSQTGPIEVGAEAYLAFRKDATAFFSELGLDDDLVDPSSFPSTLYVDGALHAVPRNTVMGVPTCSKGLEGLLSEETLKRIDSEKDPAVIDPMHWVVGDDCNLGALVAARLGQEVVDRVVSPLLGGVYSCLADDLGLRSTIPQLAQALDALATAGEHVSLTGAAQAVIEERKSQQQARLGSEDATKQATSVEERKPPVVFHTFRSGFGSMTKALVEQSGAEVALSSEVVSVQSEPRGVLVGIRSELGIEEVHVDGLVLATPAPVTAQLLRDAVPDAAELISGVDLADSAVVALRFASDEGLPELNGVLCTADADITAKAFTVSSRKWPHLAERGGAIVRASFGRFGQAEMLEWSDETLIDVALADFAQVTGFKQPVAEAFVQRWYGGIPRYGVGHTQLMQFAESELAQLKHVGIAGAWRCGPGIPACMDSASAAVRKVVSELG